MMGVFCVAVFWIYKTLPKERRHVRVAMTALTGLILALSGQIAPDSRLIHWGLILGGTALLWGIARSAETEFGGENETYGGIYGIASTIMLFGIIMTILTRGGGGIQWTAGIALLVILAAIIKESLSHAGVQGRRSTVTSATMGILVVEIMWILSFLPVHTASNAALATLIVIALIHTVKAHYKGILGVKTVLQQATVVICVALLVLVVTKWNI